MRPGIAIYLKAVLSGAMAVSLWMMWGSRDFVAEAYRQTPNTLELRLGGVDLAVARSEIEQSPFSMPAAPDTRRRPLPAIGLSIDDLVEEAPPLEMTGGTSRLRGTIVGPEGPVDQAVVGIERHTSHGRGLLRVTTTADGTWSADGLPGGRYRVRAWVPGLMTMDRSDVVFVGEHEVADFGFSLWGVDPEPAMEFVTGGPIHDGLSGTVAIVINRQSVDQDGFVVTNPVAGTSVSIAVSPDMTLTSSPTQVTDQQGAARFVLTCIPAPLPPQPSTTAPPGAPTGGPGIDNGTPADSGTGVVRGSTTGVALPVPSAGPAAALNSTGTLTARSGSVLESFPLPGCIPAPVDDSQPSSGGDGDAAETGAAGVAQAGGAGGGGGGG